MKTFLILFLLLTLGVPAFADAPVVTIGAPVGRVVSPPGPVVDLDVAPHPPLFYRTMQSAWKLTPKALPDEAGLRTMLVSGSGEFNGRQFDEMLADFRKAGAKRVIVVDLRQESHITVNNMDVYWSQPYNSVNWGKTKAQIEADEARHVEQTQTAGKLDVHPYVNGCHIHPELALVTTYKVDVKQAGTEKGLVEAHGASYVRLPVPDDQRPADAQVDGFVALVKSLQAGDWLHIHCAAGHGRTTTQIVMYDMMRNAAMVSEADILARQGMLAGYDFAHHVAKDSKQHQWELERMAFLDRFYAYCKQVGPPYDVTWSAWSKAHP